MAMNARWWTEVRHSLGFKPGVAVIAALVLGVVLSNVPVRDGTLLDSMTFKGSSGDARQLLTVVTGTLITITGLVFGLRVVLLQLAATTYSPRLLRSFLLDRGTQAVLSTFVGTVAYSLAGLGTVGNQRGGQPFVPRLAITGALVLVLASIGMLVYYIAHMTNSIRIDTIMRNVETNARRVLHREHPLLGPADIAADSDDPSEMPSGAVVEPARRSGYVAGIETDGLLKLLTRERVSVRLLQLSGWHIVAGTPLLVVSPDDGQPPRPDVVERALAAVRIEREGKVELDLGSAIRQLVDICDRAMGTTQNDACTAVQGIHRLTDLLCDAAGRSFETRRSRDEAGVVRVVEPVMDFATHLRVVCSHIRQGGLERHPRVALEVMRMLGAVARVTAVESRRMAIRYEFDQVVADARRYLRNDADIAEMEATAVSIRVMFESRAGRAEVPLSGHPSADARRTAPG